MATASDDARVSTSEPSAAEKINVEDINKLIQAGNKLYANKDVSSACEKFEEACSLFGEKFGQTANECGEAYFLYGKCLLDLARAESDVLANISEGAAKVDESGAGGSGLGAESDKDVEKSSESDKTKTNGQVSGNDDEEMIDNEVEKVKESCEEELPASKQPEEGDQKTGEEEEKMDADQEKMDADQELEEGKKSGEEEEEEDDEESGEEDGEEGAADDEDEPKDEVVDNMQLAWEMLELSRIIFARQDSKEMKIKQAQANLALGEIGMELEHYPEAIGDFMECLRLQEKVLDPDNRSLAETFYNLGLAYSFDRHYGKSIEYFNKSISVIRMRMKNLESQEDGSNSKELQEISDLIPDILAKVEDAEYMKKNTEDIIKTATGIAFESLGEASSSGFDEPSGSAFDEPTVADDKSSSTEGVTSIGHLVRKKKKSNEEEASNDSKKICIRPSEVVDEK